uniref:J domain-containing protein n=1 Tax=Guillardia theta TaxID=55529 RepID=A0A7S4PK83_GUITH
MSQRSWREEEEEEEDAPLVRILQPAVKAKQEEREAPTPIPRPPDLKQQDKQDKQQKSQDLLRQRKPKGEVDNVNKEKKEKKEKGGDNSGDKRSGRSSPSSNLIAFLLRHSRLLAGGACLLLLVYFRILSEGVNFTNDYRDREDPFKTLGVSSSASDAEIKRVYRKLSLELHPDKNPDQSKEDVERFQHITHAYKILSDPEKKRRWLNNENPDYHGLPSDTETITDKTASSLLDPAGPPWLLLAYADWSDECWELAETWEKVGKEASAFVRVGRFNWEKERNLAKKFSCYSVPMIYAYVKGVRSTFYGSPTPANISVFLTRALEPAVSVISDVNAGGFLEDRNDKVKALLFAPVGMIKLRLAFRSFAFRFQHSMDFAEVAPRGSEKLRKLLGVENGTTIVVMREEGSRPLVYSRRMTYEKLQQIFSHFQYAEIPRLTSFNHRDLCGDGVRGHQPCVVYLHDSSQQSLPPHIIPTLRNASQETLEVDLHSGVSSQLTTFAWVDVKEQPALKRLIGNEKGRVVAMDLSQSRLLAFDEDFSSSSLARWSRGLRERMESDFEPLPQMVWRSETQEKWNLKKRGREAASTLTSLIIWICVALLLYSIKTLMLDLKLFRSRERFRKAIDKGRQRVAAMEESRRSKWEELEKQQREVQQHRVLPTSSLIPHTCSF